MKDLSSMECNGRDALFQESFAYRIDCFLFHFLLHRRPSLIFKHTSAQEHDCHKAGSTDGV